MDKVKIKELGSFGRVVSIYINPTCTQYEVRALINGDHKFMHFLDDELELVKRYEA